MLTQEQISAARSQMAEHVRWCEAMQEWGGDQSPGATVAVADFMALVGVVANVLRLADGLAAGAESLTANPLAGLLGMFGGR